MIRGKFFVTSNLLLQYTLPPLLFSGMVHILQILQRNANFLTDSLTRYLWTPDTSYQDHQNNHILLLILVISYFLKMKSAVHLLLLTQMKEMVEMVSVQNCSENVLLHLLLL